MVGKRLPTDPGGKRTMSTIEESVDVEAPVRTAYNQWTQFEEFPRFMDGVESITQVDETHLRWVADIGGVRREWDAEISEQHPDERVAWYATGGTSNAGAVTARGFPACGARALGRAAGPPPRIPRVKRPAHAATRPGSPPPRPDGPN